MNKPIENLYRKLKKEGIDTTINSLFNKIQKKGGDSTSKFDINSIYTFNKTNDIYRDGYWLISDYTVVPNILQELKNKSKKAYTLASFLIDKEISVSEIDISNPDVSYIYPVVINKKDNIINYIYNNDIDSPASITEGYAWNNYLFVI